MIELTTLARPYAEAAFEYALATKTLVQWSNALAILAAATREQTVASLLASPTATAMQKSDNLVSLCGDKINDKVTNFLSVSFG